jgi:hypothetical protein
MIDFDKLFAVIQIDNYVFDKQNSRLIAGVKDQQQVNEMVVLTAYLDDKNIKYYIDKDANIKIFTSKI